MRAKIYNQVGEVVGEMELSDAVFGLPANNDLVHQVRVGVLANMRKPVAHTKDRAEVRGGGRKPWRQKGTGRARHGSRRSPIWKGGGVAHGPRKEKDYSKKINAAMLKKAIRTVLSQKFKTENVKIIDDLRVSSSKTKDFKNIAGGLSKMFKSKGKTLVILPGKNNGISRASKNIKEVKVISVSELNILDILKFANLVFVGKAVENIK
jgi:large subunit ribosomal protein L4